MLVNFLKMLAKFINYSETSSKFISSLSKSYCTSSFHDLVEKARSKTKKAEVITPNFQDDHKKFVLGDGKIIAPTIKIAHWNINGLRSVIRTGSITKFLEDKKPDILCLNELKINSEDVHQPDILKWIPEGYTYYFNCCRKKKGIYGTAIISRFMPSDVKYGFGVEKYDREGRVLQAEFENFFLVSCYAPNQLKKDLDRMTFRNSQWDIHLKILLTNLKRKKNVILCGDLNVPINDDDVHSRDVIYRHSGHYIHERANLRKLFELGFVDTYKHIHPTEQKFTCWSHIKERRAANRGVRLDYFLLSDGGLGGLKEANVFDDVYGSDHCPVGITIDPNFTI